MIVNGQLARSKGFDLKDLWQTPDHIFSPLNKEFGFTLDPCCTAESALCDKFFTPETDGLIQSWAFEVVYCNPPYSRCNIDDWVKKCYTESRDGALVVGLLPVSTSAKWWHNWIIEKAQLRFVERRIRFKNAPYTAPFSSVVVVWGGSGVTSFRQQKPSRITER